MDVRAVLRHGRRRHGADVVAHVVDRGDDLRTRVAVVASRRVGGAVARNRAKRVLRVAGSALPATGLDVALVARASTPRASSTDLHLAIEHLFDDRGVDRA